MKRSTARILLGAVAALAIGGALVVWQAGCESFAPAFGEARAAAQDAQAAAERAEAAALASGDPEAIELATEAKAQAAAVDASLAALEAKALDWATAVEDGSFGSAEGAEVGSLLGLAGPQWGVVGTMVGGVLGGWFYRRRAIQIIKAIDAGKAASPALDEAFGSASKAIAGAMSPAVFNFVENQRN